MSAIKNFVERMLPLSLLNAWRHHQRRNALPEYRNLSTAEVFTKIYQDGAWGKSADPGQHFYSGTGSHDGVVVDSYLAAVRSFLGGLGTKPDVVDLGCGDFHVGAGIRALCANYTACDIVAPLVEFNREKYRDLDVDFRVLDLTRDALPPGEVVFIRQVLQHLSNAQIAQALPRIAAAYRYLVLSEHLPAHRSFVANLDKPAGPDTRLAVNSGIVLTSAPFRLKVRAERRLCDVPEYDGVISTTLYEL